MRQERSTLLDTPGGAALSLSQLEVTLRLCIAYGWSHSLIVSVSFALDFFFFFFSLLHRVRSFTNQKAVCLLPLWAPHPLIFVINETLSSVQPCNVSNCRNQCHSNHSGCSTLGFTHFLCTALSPFRQCWAFSCHWMQAVLERFGFKERRNSLSGC